MSSAAMFAKQRGYQVAGSDKTASPMTDRLKGQGIEIFVPHRAENVAGADAVIYTARSEYGKPGNAVCKGP